ncbi:hypothetical protein DKK70_00845 [Gilliamella apicola]|uniref:Peptidase C39 domain-containing protein n=1 Tax=Gilliamella apicola TaxID=1196095 RepID=A0A2V4E5Y2_9GAMM|nr:cysteine peptidase family C39 domain-containing protein [Gilliamella apicola]PXZ08692.1 hypothetical protein DKK70_00845 [Gilliamella apicola]
MCGFNLISNRCLSLLDEARKTKEEYEKWRAGSDRFYKYEHYFLNDYENISALFKGREYENIIYEQDIRNLISDNPNMSREEAEFILYEQAKRGYEAINNKYSKTQELINSFAIVYWAVYGTKASMSEALENRMKFYESKYGKKVDETTGKQIEIDTGSNNKQAGVDANRVKDNIDASGKARESSNFREHVVNEKGLENAGKGTTGSPTQGGAGGNWKVIDEITDPNVIKQVTPTSCGAACGQMLLKDRNIFVNQTKLRTSLKSPEQLARDLSKQGGNWDGGFVGQQAFDALNKTGSWSAMMWDKGNKVGHWVVVKGTDKAGNVLIHAPWKGTSYKMTQKEFKGTWNGVAVFNK